MVIMLRILLICLCLILSPSSPAFAEGCPLKLDEPVLITSVGQCLDGLMMKTVLDDMGIVANYVPLAGLENLVQYHQVIVTPGISYKGIVMSETTLEGEFERAKVIAEAARGDSFDLILVYLGGFTQGDPRSQELIQLLAPSADILIAFKGRSGPIAYFRRIAEERAVPFFILDDLSNLCEELDVVFSR